MQNKSDRLNRLFEAGKKNPNGKVMSLFLTAGYPTVEDTVDLVLGMDKAGADMIELGMAFSDPLADGPTIQLSSNEAIKNGISISKIFQQAEKIRDRSDIPIILMGYLNPVMHYGIEKFCKEASDTGVDALILPDVPVEESNIIREHVDKYGINLIYLVAPNTPDDRMKMIDDRSGGFVYCVSVTGVTGARSGGEVQKSVDRFIDRVNQNITKNPVMIGFGIKNHENAMNISRKVDGFIVGSALIDNIKSNYPEAGWKEKLFDFVSELKYG
jgi:tryptophan synthase alpha chain